MLNNTGNILADPDQITMVTHMTEERLPTLLAQLKHWTGLRKCEGIYVTFGVYIGLAGLLMVILLWVLFTKCHLK